MISESSTPDLADNIQREADRRQQSEDRENHQQTADVSYRTGRDVQQPQQTTDRAPQTDGSTDEGISDADELVKHLLIQSPENGYEPVPEEVRELIDK